MVRSAGRRQHAVAVTLTAIVGLGAVDGGAVAATRSRVGSVTIASDAVGGDGTLELTGSFDNLEIAASVGAASQVSAKLAGTYDDGEILPVSAGSAEQYRFATGTRWLEIPFDRPAASPVVAMFGRVNGDANADLVLYNYVLGEAYVATSDGTRFRPPRRYSYGLPRYSEPTFEAAFSDVNGDGLDDLVIMNHGADDVAGAATAVVALNTGSGFSYPAQPTWNASWCASYQRCLAGDVNGDGQGDLVAFTPQFGVVWGTLSAGGQFGDNSIWNNYFCILGEVCALGDVDGDERSDAILFKPRAAGIEKGNVLWARSTGTDFTDVRYGHGFFCVDAESCLVGDVNGDGRADIVLVKGWGSGAPTLEVLVSLSDGSSFINAVPFAWVHPPFFDTAGRTFGTFALADVTGDGRADLVEWGLVSVANPGGGTRTSGFAVDVFPVTDQPVSSPPPPPPPPPEPGGFSSVAIYNCETEQHRLYYWNFDLTSGVVSQSELTDAMYSESGFCPDPNDAPETFDLEAGHVHSLVAIDPDAIGCDGRNDPTIVACVEVALAVRGASGGPICSWYIGGQEPRCA
jgi:FG-GAP-like repeat